MPLLGFTYVYNKTNHCYNLLTQKYLNVTDDINLKVYNRVGTISKRDKNSFHILHSLNTRVTVTNIYFVFSVSQRLPLHKKRYDYS